MSRLTFHNTTLHLLLALLTGLGLGLAYSWFISPVTYVDANPAILRADFKDQYRVVIAASYASTHNLPRARARLELLNDTDPIGELSAQAQRMVGLGESLERVQPLAQLATDLQQGFASVSPTATHFTNTNIFNTPNIETTVDELSATQTPTNQLMEEATPFPTLSFEQTPLVPIQVTTSTPRPTFTPIPRPGGPFILVGQDSICEPGLPSSLLQFILMDGRRKQVPGIEIIVTWSQGEDRFFTGFKPELGNGYADFVMQADIIYNVRVVEGGAFVPNISAPSCTDPNGVKYSGGLLLTFQQP
ncbi:MAG: hypothetical protein FJZ86_06035 [Chloroflexi bacterium]|nr:hypothetical protein [Chloroflexota bacterium]